jgi:hypothetical protein
VNGSFFDSILIFSIRTPPSTSTSSQNVALAPTGIASISRVASLVEVRTLAKVPSGLCTSVDFEKIARPTCSSVLPHTA